MHHAEALVSRFARAGLALKLAPAPLTAANDAIVQLDIERRRGAERFLLWPGAEGNRVIAQTVDREKRQLVLFVDEPKRDFAVRVHRYSTRGRPVVRKDAHRDYVWVREQTSGAKRHFLCGLDEQHCFIAQLPAAAASVEQAHLRLFNPAVREAERQTGHRAVRQGEWFFVQPTLAEEQALEAAIARRELFLRRRMGVFSGGGWRRGRPHVADEVVSVDLAGPDSPLPPAAVFARGKVRHPDHATLELRHWHRVYGNRESSGPAGVSWVD